MNETIREALDGLELDHANDEYDRGYNNAIADDKALAALADRKE